MRRRANHRFASRRSSKRRAGNRLSPQRRKISRTTKDPTGGWERSRLLPSSAEPKLGMNPASVFSLVMAMALA